MTEEDLQRAERNAEDLLLWQQWKASGGTPESLAPLMARFEPMLRSKMGPYLGKVRLIPDTAIEMEFRLQFVEALKTFDPEKGNLGTHVYRAVDRAKRFIANHQNVGRVSEARVYQIKTFQTALSELQDSLGREPTTKELSEDLGWSKAEVTRMQSELRNDLVSQFFEGGDAFAFAPSVTQETLALFKYELDDKERQVFAHVTGLGAPRIESTAELSKKLGIPDYTISKIKKGIARKLAPFMDDKVS